MFNIEEFDIKLDTEFIGRNFIYIDEIDSTNSFLFNDNSIAQNGTVVLAEHQTKGRGRKNREWYSNAGQNLTFSILLNDKRYSKLMNVISLGTAVVVAQTIENLFQLNVEVKWPNDVLINKKKVCGVLIESSSKGNVINKIVIGIGINVNQPNFPGKFDLPPTSIRKEFKEEVSRERFLSELLNNFEEMLEEAFKNSEKVLNDWRAKCKMIGEKIKIVEDSNVKFGVFEDINKDGFLILKSGDKKEIIHFGDVSLR